MTPARRRTISLADDRGTALVGVLLLLMMMTALASALAVSGHTETLVARNHQSLAQARVAAEAGLNHAAEVVLPWILAWKGNYPNVDIALDTLLAGVAGNPDFFDDITFGDAGDPTAISGATNAKYHVFLMDEDDSDQRGDDDATELNGDEGGGATDDWNRTLVIQAVGYGPNNASARLEAIISPYKLPALAVNGDLTVSGSAAIGIGPHAVGGIHANGTLTLSGTTAIAGVLDPSDPLAGIDLSKGTATASGNYIPGSVVPTGETGGGKALLDIPEVDPEDFRSWADRILVPNGSTGYITDAAGNVLPGCSTTGNSGNACQSAYGWRYDKNAQEWELTTTAANGFTYYVQGPARISGGTAAAPIIATVIATGSISATGGYIQPEAGDLLFVTGQDFNVSGNFKANLAEGQILVREQVDITSSAVALLGQIVVQNATSTGAPHTNGVNAASILNYTDVGSSMFRISGWREVR